MGFALRIVTTGKVKRLEGARQETEYCNEVEEFQTPPSLKLNIDQINSKYNSMEKAAIAKKGSTSVPIGGLSNKRSITVTFTITLNGIFLLI